jgi:hypothetical protein
MMVVAACTNSLYKFQIELILKPKLHFFTNANELELVTMMSFFFGIKPCKSDANTKNNTAFPTFGCPEQLITLSSDEKTNHYEEVGVLPSWRCALRMAFSLESRIRRAMVLCSHMLTRVGVLTRRVEFRTSGRNILVLYVPLDRRLCSMNNSIVDYVYHAFYSPFSIVYNRAETKTKMIP